MTTSFQRILWPLPTLSSRSYILLKIIFMIFKITTSLDKQWLVDFLDKQCKYPYQSFLFFIHSSKLTNLLWKFASANSLHLRKIIEYFFLNGLLLLDDLLALGLWETLTSGRSPTCSGQRGSWRPLLRDSSKFRLKRFLDSGHLPSGTNVRSTLLYNQRMQ